MAIQTLTLIINSSLQEDALESAGSSETLFGSEDGLLAWHSAYPGETTVSFLQTFPGFAGATLQLHDDGSLLPPAPDYFYMLQPMRGPTSGDANDSASSVAIGQEAFRPLIIVDDGGAGPNTVAALSGDDTSVVNDPNGGGLEGSGTVFISSPVTYYLEPNVETFSITDSGNINVTGNALDNVIVGNSGDNILNGGAGDDILSGGAGDDSLYGGKGTDIAEFSGAYADYEITPLYWGKDGGVVRGYQVSSAAEGVDFVASDVEYLRFSDQLVDLGSWGSISVFPGTSGNDTLYGTDGADQIGGRGGDDVLYGGQGDDTLGGDAGNDYLRGDSGADSLSGGDGDDTLVGGPGDDSLYGGKGTDIAEFSGAYADYEITPLYWGKDGGGVRGYQVSSEAEGVDFIATDVEYLSFSDRQIMLEWQAPAAASENDTPDSTPTAAQEGPLIYVPAPSVAVAPSAVLEADLSSLDDVGINLVGLPQTVFE